MRKPPVSGSLKRISERHWRDEMERLIALLREMGIPFAYDHFAEGESPDPPFLCYLLPDSGHFPADGRVYFKIEEVRIELYTDRKDPAAERKVEAVLDQHGIFYARSEVWIESEKLYEVLYSFEMEGNNDAQEE
jgi:hypothetical protein